MNSFKRVPQLFGRNLNYAAPRRSFATTAGEHPIWEKNKNVIIGAGVLSAAYIYYAMSKPKQSGPRQDKPEGGAGSK
jgi:hypothetical protein